MKLKLIVLFFVLKLLEIQFVFAQSYSANGNASSLGGNCYELTPNKVWQNGSIWFKNKIDLNKAFDFEFTMNFGNSDGGADGMVFVLQNKGTNALGNNGGGLGFEGFSPALGIEFDDYQNTDNNDLSSDHIAIIKNGILNHSSNSFPSPVSALSNSGNIEDGKNHLVRIIWNPSIKEIKVFFDCELRISTKIDIVKDIFTNNSSVWWGFTSATGGLHNQQTVCLRDDIYMPDTVNVCVNSSVSLTSRLSDKNDYTWLPNQYLNNNKIRNPLCTPTSNIKYKISYTDKCNNVITDSIYVKIIDSAKVDINRDTFFCKSKSSIIKVYAYKGNIIGWNDGSTGLSKQINIPGKYIFRTQTICNIARDTCNVREWATPKLDFPRPYSFCKGDSIMLTPNFSGEYHYIKWHDSTVIHSKKVKNKMIAWAEIRSPCGNSWDTTTINVINKPLLKLSNDTSFCDGDTVLVKVNEHENGIFKWSNGSTDEIIKTFTASKFIGISENECGKTLDSVIVDKRLYSKVNLGNDTVLCENTNFTKSISNTNFYNIKWQDGSTNNIFQINNFGKYWLTAYNNLCKSSDTLIVNDAKSKRLLLKDTAICQNNDFIIKFPSNIIKVEWGDGSNLMTRNLRNTSGNYSYTITDQCGTYSKNFNLQLLDCNCFVWIPNAITSNSDDLNENFEIKYDCDIKDFKLSIYTRWGEKVFESNDPNFKWDIKYQDQNVQLDSYIWSISYLGFEKGISKYFRKKGTLTILK